MGIMVLYQNCSSPFSFDSNDSESTSSENPVSNFQRNGNGDSYDGKLTGTYLGYDPDQPCEKIESDGLPTPNGIIRFNAGQAYKMRSHCEDQDAQSLVPESYITSMFNARVVSHDGLHYESTSLVKNSNLDFPRYVSNSCRGFINSSASGNNELIDVVIRTNKNWTNSDPHYTGELIKALENSSDVSISQVQILSESLVSRSVDSQMRQVFSQSTTSHSFQLSIGENGQGELVASIGAANYKGTVACDFEKTESNFLANSNNFDLGPWYSHSGSAGPVGLTPAAAQAPDGSMTAWSLFDQSGTGWSWLRYIAHSTAPTDQQVRTFSVHMKKDTSPETQVKILYNGGSTTVHAGYVRVLWADDGTATLEEATAVSGSGITDVGNGWYRIWVSVQNNGTGNIRAIPAIYPVEPNNGDSDKSVLLWGAQLELGGEVSPYLSN